MNSVNNGRICQESFETGSTDCKDRAKQLRKLGYEVISSSLGIQVTPVGMIKTTMLHILPGLNSDTCDLPEIEKIF